MAPLLVIRAVIPGHVGAGVPKTPQLGADAGWGRDCYLGSDCWFLDYKNLRCV